MQLYLSGKASQSEQNFVKSKYYCLGKKTGFGSGLSSRALWGEKRQCSFLLSSTFNPKGWWVAWITVYIPEQPTWGHLISSYSSNTKSQGRGTAYEHDTSEVHKDRQCQKDLRSFWPAWGLLASSSCFKLCYWEHGFKVCSKPKGDKQ